MDLLHHAESLELAIDGYEPIKDLVASPTSDVHALSKCAGVDARDLPLHPVPVPTGTRMWHGSRFKSIRFAALKRSQLQSRIKRIRKRHCRLNAVSDVVVEIVSLETLL